MVTNYISLLGFLVRLLPFWQKHSSGTSMAALANDTILLIKVSADVQHESLNRPTILHRKGRAACAGHTHNIPHLLHNAATTLAYHTHYARSYQSELVCH